MEKEFDSLMKKEKRYGKPSVDISRPDLEDERAKNKFDLHYGHADSCLETKVGPVKDGNHVPPEVFLFIKDGIFPDSNLKRYLPHLSECSQCTKNYNVYFPNRPLGKS